MSIAHFIGLRFLLLAVGAFYPFLTVARAYINPGLLK